MTWESSNLPPVHRNPVPPLLTNKVYDILKAIVTIVLPGVGTLYFALSQIWGFPAAEQVVGTIAAVNVFFGLLIQVASKSYNTSDAKYDGVVDVKEDLDGRTKFLLNLDGDPDDLKGQKSITFRVRNI